jgi:hypothetical protein
MLQARQQADYLNDRFTRGAIKLTYNTGWYHPTPVNNSNWRNGFVNQPAGLPAHNTYMPDPEQYPVKMAALNAVETINSTFRANVMKVVRKYEMQSLQHYALRIDATAVSRHIGDYPVEGIYVQFRSGFGPFTKKKIRFCRMDCPTKGMISVYETAGQRRSLPLDESLTSLFPPNKELVTEDIMREYWDKNGKYLNWAGLPAELKLDILDNCVSSLCSYRDWFHGLPRASSAPGTRKRPHPRSRRDPPELVEKLGAWKGLCGIASKSVREVVLDLLLKRSTAYPHGFCITSENFAKFSQRLEGLDQCYQMSKPNSMPKLDEDNATILQQQYKLFPKQHPQHDQFATLKHGIRKVKLQFTFLDSMHFFKVTKDNIHLQRDSDLVTCEVLDQMPNLTEIHIDLPTRYDHRCEWSGYRYGPLVHNEDPCPRTLHRVIYEQIAIELATHENVSVRNLMDEDEELRFKAMRKSAQRRHKLTAADMVELYAVGTEEREGGILLPADDLGE